MKDLIGIIAIVVAVFLLYTYREKIMSYAESKFAFIKPVAPGPEPGSPPTADQKFIEGMKKMAEGNYDYYGAGNTGTPPNEMPLINEVLELIGPLNREQIQELDPTAKLAMVSRDYSYSNKAKLLTNYEASIKKQLQEQGPAVRATELYKRLTNV